MAFNDIIQQTILVNFKASIADFKKGINEVNNSIRNTISGFNETISANKKLDKSVDNSKRKFGGFRFELLSVFFFAQMLQRALVGLLGPAFEAAGIFEIFGYILELIFLPIAIELLDPLIKLSEWFAALPEDTKLGIGALVLIGGFVMGLIVFFAQLGMLLSSFGITFSGLGGLVLSGIGGLGTILAGALGVIASFISGIFAAGPIAVAGFFIMIGLLIVSFIYNAEGYFEAFRKTIEDIWNGIVRIFDGIMLIIEGILTGDLSKIIEGAKEVFMGFFDFLYSATYGAMLNFGKAFMDGLGNAYQELRKFLLSLGPIGELILGGTDAVAGFVSSIGQGISDAIAGLLNWAGEGISGILKGIGIPGFATGGIVTGPTLAMVGEAGPEAIIPLNNLGGVGGKVINYNPTYTFNNELNNSSDIDYFINEIERRQAIDYERLRRL